MEEILHSIYYNPKTGFGSAADLRRKAHGKGIRPTLKQIKEWLKKQTIQQHHTPSRKITAYARIKSSGVGDLHQYDIVDMTGKWAQKQGGRGKKPIKYLLTGIDVFSRKAHAVPLTSKNAEDVLAGIIAIQTVLGKPKRVEVDQGKEFMAEVDKYWRNENIHVRRGDPGIHRHQSLIEAFHKSFEKIMIKFMRTNKWRWLEHLDDLLENYNSRLHSGVRGVPNDIHSGKIKPAKQPPRLAKHHLKALKPGDHVRYAYDKPEGAARRRAYDQIWSDEIAVVVRTVGEARGPRLHYLITVDGALDRPYYREELLIATKPTRKNIIPLD